MILQMTWHNPTRAAALILLTTAAIAGCGGVTTSILEPSFPAAKRAALDVALTKTMADLKVPGVVVGVWIPGEGTYVVTRGVSDLATSKAMQRKRFMGLLGRKVARAVPGLAWRPRVSVAGRNPPGP